MLFSHLKKPWDKVLLVLSALMTVITISWQTNSTHKQTAGKQSLAPPLKLNKCDWWTQKRECVWKHQWKTYENNKWIREDSSNLILELSSRLMRHFSWEEVNGGQIIIVRFTAEDASSWPGGKQLWSEREREWDTKQLRRGRTELLHPTPPRGGEGVHVMCPWEAPAEVSGRDALHHVCCAPLLPPPPPPPWRLLSLCGEHK